MCLTVFREIEVTARKPSRCIWCGDGIVVGEKHWRQVGRMEGEIQDGRFHQECWTASHEFFQANKMECEFEEWGFKRGSFEPR